MKAGTGKKIERLGRTTEGLLGFKYYGEATKTGTMATTTARADDGIVKKVVGDERRDRSGGDKTSKTSREADYARL